MAITYSSLFESTDLQSVTAGAFVTSSSYRYAGPMPEKRGEVVSFSGTVTVSSNLATGDKVRFIQVPKGTRLKSFTHEWGDLDSSTTLVADLGWETTDQDAFLAASAIYQAADTTIASGTGSNSLTEELTELVFDNSATTSDADYLTLTATTGATSLAATRTITFRGQVYIP